MPDLSSSNNSLAIETVELRKVYGQQVAVEGLTLAVTPGEVFGFLGPNGAGKSTLIKMLMGLVYPTVGSARLFGQPIGNLQVKRRIGFLPEQFRFPDWLKARELLDFHGKLARMPESERKRRSNEVLRLVGLGDRGDDILRTFSKGMLQRIGLAQALLADPDLIFLDEPTSALDPLGRREVRDIIHQLKQAGKTVFLNSHMLSEIELVCDRVVIIDRGRVVREGQLTTLLNRKELEVRVGGLTPELISALAARFDIVETRDGLMVMTIENVEAIPQVAEMVVQSGARLYGISERKGSLEELFAEAVHGGAE